LQLFLDFSGIFVFAAEADTLKSDVIQVKYPAVLPVKSLIQVAVKPFGRGMFQLELQRQIELL
jgi:hypothetical protein